MTLLKADNFEKKHTIIAFLRYYFFLLFIAEMVASSPQFLHCIVNI